MSESYVYRCFDELGNLLYVGKSDRIESRLSQHRKDAPWWNLVAEVRTTRYGSSRDAWKAETAAIADEGPLYNRTSTPGWLANERTPRERVDWKPTATVENPVSAAKARLTELVRETTESDVVLTRHGRPAAVMMSAERHAELMETLDDLEDRLSVYEGADDISIPWEKLKAEMGA